MQTAAAEKSERKIIFLLCVLAAVHVFIFSAAFPLHNNVDEQAHADLAIKFSHGHLPRGLENYSQETAEYFVIYGSQEFFFAPEIQSGGKIPPPLWTQPIDKVAPVLLDREAKWKELNHESSQPPLYYALAGFCWKCGGWLGFDGGRRLYCLRFLNVPIVVALVWLGFLTARRIFPENLFLQIGVPALIAFMPQTAFYSIDNDILSPLTFGAAFLFLVQFWRAEIPDYKIAFGLGLTLAATWLAKSSNLPFLIIVAAIVAVKIFSLAQSKNFHAALPPLAALFFCAALPVGAWASWCKIHFGDLTGSAVKIHLLTWTVKPFADWWHHMIFTPMGFWRFLSELLGNFWQGEFVWHGGQMSLPLTNGIYTILSVGLAAVAGINLFPKFSSAARQQRQMLWISLAIFVAGILFLALLSVIYDFGDCPNPSRVHPYFNQGRLLLGALIPFLLLFVFGIDRLLNRFSNRAKFISLAIFISAMLVLEIATDWPAIFNEYNWFHM